MKKTQLLLALKKNLEYQQKLNISKKYREEQQKCQELEEQQKRQELEEQQKRQELEEQQKMSRLNSASLKIILLIRSYNRPEYFEKTLKSVLDADIDLCIKRYIYDDGSDDETTINLLTNNEYINVNKKEFYVIRSVNEGCKISYIKALEYIKNDNTDLSNYLICTIDNDIIAKPNFISILINEYINAYNKYLTFDILLTGFNPKNAHVNMIEDNGSFYRKSSCGGVNFVFHINFIDFIISGWNLFLDWGVVDEMNRQDMPICCLKKSVINHFGYFGLNSNGYADNDSEF